MGASRFTSHDDCGKLQLNQNEPKLGLCLLPLTLSHYEC